MWPNLQFPLTNHAHISFAWPGSRIWWEKGQEEPAVHEPTLKNLQGTWERSLATRSDGFDERCMEEAKAGDILLVEGLCLEPFSLSRSRSLSPTSLDESEGGSWSLRLESVAGMGMLGRRGEERVGVEDG